MPNDTTIFIKNIKKILEDYLNSDQLQSARLELSSLSSKPEDDFGLSKLDNKQRACLLHILTKLEEERQKEVDEKNKDRDNQFAAPGVRLARPFKEAKDIISEEDLKQIIADIQSPSNSSLGVSGVYSANMEVVPVADPPATSVQPYQGHCFVAIRGAFSNLYRRVNGL